MVVLEERKRKILTEECSDVSTPTFQREAIVLPMFFLFVFQQAVE